MPHTNFNPDSIDWRDFFSQPQTGGSSYFRGLPYMRGSGVGTIFRSLYRFLLPISKSIGREVGKEGLAVGARALGDIVKGDDPGHALSSHSKEGLRNLLNKASDKLQQGSGKRRKKAKRKKSVMRGSGTKEYIYNIKANGKRKRNSGHLSKKFFSERSVLEGPPRKKRKSRKRVDPLGLY